MTSRKRQPRNPRTKRGQPRSTRNPGKRPPKPRGRRKPRQTAAPRTRTAGFGASIEVQELESLRNELERVAKGAPPRWNPDAEDVRRSVAKLVLTLVEFIRQLLERQAIRRMEAGTLDPQQTEAVGVALMRLEETIRDLAAQFGLTADDLNLDLGPVGRLM